MSDDYFVVTNRHLNLAAKYGEQAAKTRISSGHPEPLTEIELWDQHPPEDVVFYITGEKMHDVAENYLVLDAFEEGYYYYEGWDNDDEE